MFVSKRRSHGKWEMESACYEHFITRHDRAYEMGYMLREMRDIG